MTTKARVFVLLAGVGAALGCSAPDPFDYSRFDELQARNVEPLRARVRVEQDASMLPEDSFVPRVLRPETKPAIAAAVRETLERHRAFASVVDASSESGSAPEDAADIEVLVEVDATSVPAWNSKPKEWGSRWWWYLPLWFVGPFSWIPNDREFATTVTLSFSIRRLREEEDSGAPPEAVSRQPSGDRGLVMPPRRVPLEDAYDLRFVRRAGFPQYALNIVVPTPWVPPDIEVADENLLENFISALEQSIGRAAKEEFLYRVLQASNAHPHLRAWKLANGDVALVLLTNFHLDPMPARITGDGERARDVEIDWIALEDADLAIQERIQSDPEYATVLATEQYGEVWVATLSPPPETVRILPAFVGERGRVRWGWTLDPDQLELLDGGEGSPDRTVARR